MSELTQPNKLLIVVEPWHGVPAGIRSMFERTLGNAVDVEVVHLDGLPELAGRVPMLILVDPFVKPRFDDLSREMLDEIKKWFPEAPVVAWTTTISDEHEFTLYDEYSVELKLRKAWDPVETAQKVAGLMDLTVYGPG